MTRRTRTIRQRIAESADSLRWEWFYHGHAYKRGIFGGFAFTSFVVLMAFYFVVGLS